MSEAIPNKYCRHCGAELKIFDVHAELVEQSVYDSGGGSWWRLASPFDPKTGKRNIATIYVCQEYRRRWYGENAHDIFAVFDGRIEWGVRVKV
jgi:hypothetical protein